MEVDEVGGHLVKGSSLTRNIVFYWCMYFLNNHNFLHFQMVWFVKNIRDVVMTLHTYEQ